mmetsp:Transcript_46937/g.110502  ORF Transcript_46937/g.110502 Transcript_46937/m.110502 type:complete len:219 (-) Transcript_46937:253-909(-)
MSLRKAFKTSEGRVKELEEKMRSQASALEEATALSTAEQRLGKGLRDEVEKLSAKLKQVVADADAVKARLSESEREADKWRKEARKLSDEGEELTKEVQQLRQGRERSELVEKKEVELRNLVAKITHVEEAMEGSLTCMVCMELVKDAVVLTPCGHISCDGCFKSSAAAASDGRPFCQDCGEGSRTTAVEVEALDHLVSKFTYKRQAWSQLLELGVHA